MQYAYHGSLFNHNIYLSYDMKEVLTQVYLLDLNLQFGEVGIDDGLVLQSKVCAFVLCVCVYRYRYI